MEKINSALIVGGTHGNELSGIYLNKLIKDHHYNAQRTSFTTRTATGNPDAVKHNVRYLNADLNRQFADLSKAADSPVREANVAHAFATQHGNAEQQLIVDLHNTTSNMGATLILLSTDSFYRKMGAFVKQQMPHANILFEDRKAWNEQPYLCSVGDYGVMIEVGAQAHSSLKADVLDLMKEMLTAVLDYVEAHNLKGLEPLSDYEAFFYTEEVFVPLDQDGMRNAMVHPERCGKDFEAVKQGDPLLLTFDGQVISWEQEQATFPHFINESAYCISHITMSLADKRTVSAS